MNGFNRTFTGEVSELTRRFEARGGMIISSERAEART